MAGWTMSVVTDQAVSSVPAPIAGRSPRVSTGGPAIHALAHVALVGLRVPLLTHVPSWSSAHTRPTGSLHHGPSARVGPGTHHSPA